MIIASKEEKCQAMKKSVAKNFTAGLFWDVRREELDYKKDKFYIVHRVLSYGTMDDLRNLLAVYGKTAVRRVFLKPDPGVYGRSILRLCQHLLGVKKIDERQYVKYMRGPAIRSPRQTG